MSPKTNEFGDVEIGAAGKPNEFGDMPIEDSGKQEDVSKPKTWRDTAAKAIAWTAQHVGTPADLTVGLGGAVLEPIIYGGDLIRRATGQRRIINDPQVRKLTEPVPTAMGAIGRMVEPVAELAVAPEIKAEQVPAWATRMVQRGGKLVPELKTTIQSGIEAAKMGAQAALHGDNPKWSAAFGAAGPVIGRTLEEISGPLSKGAQNLYERALNPTKQVTKAEAQKVVPELMTREFWASTFPRYVEQAKAKLTGATEALEKAEDAAVAESKSTYGLTGRTTTRTVPGSQAHGPIIDIQPEYPAGAAAPPGSPQLAQSTAVGPFTGNVGPTTAAETGGRSAQRQTIYETGTDKFDLRPVLNRLRSMMGEYQVQGKAPTKQAAVALKQLKDQYNRIAQFGRYVGLEDAIQLRRILDKPLGEKGLFALSPKWASLEQVQRNAANTLRNEINTAYPQLAQANGEYSFWKNVTHVAEETQNRKVGQKLMTHMLATSAVLGGEVASGKRDISDIPGMVKDALILNGAMSFATSTGMRTLTGIQMGNLAKFIGQGDAGKFFEYAGTAVRPRQAQSPWQVPPVPQ